jgi:DTW domain-containing protein
MSHAVSLLRAAHLTNANKLFLARGGFKSERCTGCRLVPTHCMCALRTSMRTRAGVCLLMAEIEPLKPTNTGWLVADLVADTFAFGWSRTQPDPALLSLLNDPNWDCYVVFPGQYAPPERVVHSVRSSATAHAKTSQRPLFILLDGTWSEARKMFQKSPCLNHLPVLSLHPALVSRYKLRRSRRDDHFCTSEVAAQCLDLAGDHRAAQALEAYLEVFSHHYLQAKNQQPVAWGGAAHRRLQELVGRQGAVARGDAELEVTPAA